MNVGSGKQGGGQNDGSRGSGNFGGDSKNNQYIPPPTPKPPATTVKNQTFKVYCYGMKPNTVHKFYYEGFDMGKDCLPVYPKPTNVSSVKPGAELKTDASGKIEFDFYFTVDIEKQVDGTKKYELAGDKKFELIAVGSSASKIVPFKKYTTKKP